MANSKGVVSTTPFSNQRNVRSGSGPVYYSWEPSVSSPNQKNLSKKITCDNKIDNITTYVYEELSNGNHLSYVLCDYVI
jgi:hypothetical protein